MVPIAGSNACMLRCLASAPPSWSCFERIVALSNAKATEFTTTIPVLVYKWFQGNKFSESTALGLFQSVIGVILVIASDRVAKKLGEDGLL